MKLRQPLKTWNSSPLCTTQQSTRRPRNLFHQHDHVTSSNLVWISNKLNAWWTFKHCFSQIASLIKTILTRHVERSVYCKFMVLLFLLAASYGGRGSACLQDSGSDMGHLWFVVQIGAKWSYKTIVAAWVHYNQQYNILELEKKAQIPRIIWSIPFWKEWPRRIKHTNSTEHAMNTANAA